MSGSTTQSMQVNQTGNFFLDFFEVRLEESIRRRKMQGRRGILEMMTLLERLL